MMMIIIIMMMMIIIVIIIIIIIIIIISRVEDFKTLFWTEGATIFRTSQVLKDVGMFVGGEMFTDASGEVSIGFTNITGITACT